MKALVGAVPAAFVLLLAAAIPAAKSTGSWQRLAAAPVAPNEALTAAWTGKQMVVVGTNVKRAKDGAILSRSIVAASYDPAARTWRKLEPTGAPASDGNVSSVWTGKEVLVWGQGSHEAYNPATDRWRTFPSSPLLSIHDAHGLVVWTGRELIGWGGGCCGDAFSDGVAYNPATNRWRGLPRGPLAGSQHPVGSWTGRELVVLVGNTNPDGKRWPARLARAAAYNPATNAWRRIAKPPVDLGAATTAWDGREVLAVSPGGSKAAYAYNPATNGWRTLARMPSGRTGAAAVWTGMRVLLWGGQQARATGAAPTLPRAGLAYDPKANRWSTLPTSPIVGRLGMSAVWTRRALIVFGGSRPARPSGTTYLADGAAYTP